MKRFLLIVSLTIGIVGCAFYVSFVSGFFHVSQINLTQLDPNASEVIFKEIEPKIEKALLQFKGKNIWEADVEKIAELIKLNLAVKEVRVWRVFPGTLQVQIETKRVAAMLINNSGAVFPITEDSD